MPSWSTYSYLFGPLVAAAGMGALILVLLWAFNGRRQSLVAGPAEPSGADDYGLMVPVSDPADYATAEMQRMALNDAGIRANVVQTLDGPRLMVFRNDLDRALDVLKQ